MANLFQGKDHAKVYSQSRQSTPQQLIDRVISFVKEKLPGNLSLAVDAGCGSGQNTFSYSEAFGHVIGTDASGAQIEVASSRNAKVNVEFQVALAHEIPAGDGTVQLVTASAAAHWFDIQKFFQECERVLCKNGVVAIYSYNMFPVLTFLGADVKDKSEDVNRLVDKMYYETLKGYWDFEKAQLVIDQYKNITIPLLDLTREYDFFNDYEMSLTSVVARLKSSSGFQTFCKLEGEQAGEKAMRDFVQNVYGLLGDSYSHTPPEDILFHARDSLFLVMARK